MTPGVLVRWPRGPHRIEVPPALRYLAAWSWARRPAVITRTASLARSLSTLDLLYPVEMRRSVDIAIDANGNIVPGLPDLARLVLSRGLVLSAGPRSASTAMTTV